jgi:hypothetical protein
MKKELDEALCAKYPEIFRDRHGKMSETAMCWGFACGDGWYPLIDRLCALLMADVTQLRESLAFAQKTLANPDAPAWAKEAYTPAKRERLEQQLAEAVQQLPVATQVKEKFGGLRFYYSSGKPEHAYYVRFAESMSYSICEDCGTTANVRRTTGWIRTICVPCATEQNLLDRLTEDADDDA